MEDQKLEASLYKLLLYEKGSFFLAHRDGEKLDRMVATLVIALPSSHEGGELIVRHEGREQTVDFSKQSKFQTQFAAFYADCEHEIRPVTSGFRLALVYNLTLEPSKSAITAPKSREHVPALARLFKEWSRQSRQDADADGDSFPTKLAVLLEHQYSQEGLPHNALKGIDRARAEVLFAAAREADCDASLALVTYWVSGSAELSENSYGYSRHRWSRRYDDDFNHDSGGSHVMGEEFDSLLSAQHFSDAEGNPLSYGKIPLKEIELVSKQPLKEGKPDKEDFEGYTGNAGMTLERCYHLAAVVAWPMESRFDVLCEGGVHAALGGLDQLIRRWKQAKRDEQAALRSSCVEFADRIIANWPERLYSSGYDPLNDYAGDEIEFDAELDMDETDEESEFLGEEDASDGGSIPVGDALPDSAANGVSVRPFGLMLKDLADVSLVSAWIRRVLGRNADFDPGRTLGDLCQEHGWLTFQDELTELFEGTSRETIARHARLLADFSSRRDRSPDRGKLCLRLAERLVSFFEEWEPRPAKLDWRAKTVELSKLLPPLLRAILNLEEPRLLDRMATSLLDRPGQFDWTTVQIPAILSLEAWLKRKLKHAVPPLQRWFTAVVAELESRASRSPLEPADWTRESSTGCSCEDCEQLSRFLKDPDQAILRLPLAKERRQHLHQIIDGKNLDTTHVTERSGRPFTLVFTKTKAAYERQLRAHHVDLSHLAKMRTLLKWHCGLSSRSVRPAKSAKKSKTSKRK